MTTRTFHVGPAAIEAHLRGAGDPVVLLPGLGGDVSIFDALAESLAAAGFRAIAINPRGVAGSSGPLGNLTLHDLAKDVAGVIEALGAGPAHVVGKAFGNRVARCLATDRPDLVRSLVLLNAGGLVPPDAEAASALRALAEAEVFTEGDLDVIRAALFSPSSDPRTALGMKRWRAARAAQVAAAGATPASEWWAGGSAPILVVQGLDDRVAPPENGRALAREFPERVQLVEIAGAGHALLPEKPRQVAEAVIAYLKAR